MDTLLVIPFIASPSVSLDGRIDEEVYQRALVVDRFYPIYPDTIRTYPVRLYLFHDGKNLYVGGEFINPYGIHAQTTERDRVNDVMDDQVLITLSHRDIGYYLGLYPLGTQMDQLITSYNRWSLRWDLDWKSASVYRDSVWTFEMIIPVYRLELSDTIGFRVDVVHILPQEMGWFQLESTYKFPLEEISDIRHSSRAVFEGGITYEKGKPNITVSPYLVGVYTNPYRDIGYFPIKGSLFHYRIGGDVEVKTNRWGLYTTILPDYSQVEADVAQFNLEQASMLYLPEKRPFFQDKLELIDKDILDIFYTRAIRDITFGFKGFYESESRKLQSFYIREGANNYAGLALGYQRGDILLVPYFLNYRDTSLERNVGSLFARYYRRGWSLSLQGAYTGGGAKAFGLSTTYSHMGVGGFYLNVEGFTDDFDFPTAYLPYGPGFLYYGGGIWLNRNRRSPYLYFMNANISYSGRRFLKDGEFFSENINANLGAGVVKNFLVMLYMNRYSSLPVSYDVQGGAVGIGPDFSRIIMLGAGYGAYDGNPMRHYTVGGTYMVGRVRMRASMEMYEISDTTISRMLIANIGATVRFKTGFYVSAFYQRNESFTTGTFPGEELQVVIGYEWGGRSRLYFIVHPYRVGDVKYNNEFFKVAYSFYF